MGPGADAALALCTVFSTSPPSGWADVKLLLWWIEWGYVRLGHQLFVASIQVEVLRGILFSIPDDIKRCWYLLHCEKNLHKFEGVWSCLLLLSVVPQKVFGSPQCCNPTLDLSLQPVYFLLFLCGLPPLLLPLQSISLCHPVGIE